MALKTTVMGLMIVVETVLKRRVLEIEELKF